MHKKSKKVPSLLKFSIILSNLSHEDKIGHSFTVDIKFQDKNSKILLFNEISTPRFEKETVVRAHESSILQLMIVLGRNEDKDIINNFKCNAKKTHSTIDEKNVYSTLCWTHPFFSDKGRVDSDKNFPTLYIWTMQILKKSVIMNQKSRQKATSPVERNFYKFLNNTNFGNDCQNNINNCTWTYRWWNWRNWMHKKNWQHI